MIDSLLMATSYSFFGALPYEQQLGLVWQEGQFVARRWEEEEGISLYFMEGGFFCEVYLEVELYTVTRLDCFAVDSGRLADYACYFKLDDLLHMQIQNSDLQCFKQNKIAHLLTFSYFKNDSQL